MKQHDGYIGQITDAYFRLLTGCGNSELLSDEKLLEFGINDVPETPDVPPTLQTVKTQALAEIKAIRSMGLDKAAISSGVLAMYDANYAASVELLEGRGDTVMKNGITAEVYLTGFGGRLGMTGIQFAQYIIDENRRVGPTVYEIEKRYLALTYGGDIPQGIYPVSVLTTQEQVEAAVTAFRTYCGL